MASQDLKSSQGISMKQSAFKNVKLGQLRQSLINSSKTKTESQRSQFPNINYTQRKPVNRQAQKMLSITNRHLRYLYHQFCKQSYIGGAHATFDDISQSAENMTMNKWMVFCREFAITDKLSNRDLTLIFRTATKQKALMNLQEFCIAIDIAKQRMKINPQIFASEVLHVDSHASARKRLCVMKINFSGPKTNFFMQSMLTEKQRQEQKKQTKQLKQKQRQLVLHQGMFKQHIEMSLLQRKNERKEKMQKIRNRSAMYNSQSDKNSQKKSISIVQKYKKQPLIHVPSPNKSSKTRSIFSNYSKIFEIKRANNTGSTQNGSYLMKRKDTDQRRQTQGQSKSRLAFEEQRDSNNELIRDQYDENVKQMSQKWQINSQAQSDQILKTHFENEKKIGKQSAIMRKQSALIRKQSALMRNQSGLKLPNPEQQNDTDLMITRYN